MLEVEVSLQYELLVYLHLKPLPLTVDRYNCIRDVCIQYFLDHSSMIGGPGVEVEIDESKFGKRKYNRGRQVEGHWVFGGVERVTGECFMMEVARRDAATLIPIIQQYIRPGSIIHSDQWAAYNQITAATGMAHMTVNHSLDPATGVHTQGVESMCCKRLMREERTNYLRPTSQNLCGDDGLVDQKHFPIF